MTQRVDVMWFRGVSGASQGLLDTVKDGTDGGKVYE